MTRRPDNVVTLSTRDWLGLIGIFVTLITLMLAAYLRHDRYLTEVLVRQEYLAIQQVAISDRIDKIETRLQNFKE